MIGITFCGTTGVGVKVEGTFLGSVTCDKCKKVTPNPVRFRGASEPLTINGGKVVHAGLLHSALDLGRHLDNLAVEAVFCLFDKTRLSVVEAAIDAERVVVEVELAREAAVVQAAIDALEAERVKLARKEQAALEAETS